MRFYNRQHTYYCGIDLHVKTMYVCILDGAGQVLVDRNVPSTPAAFLEIVAPYRDGLVVAEGAAALETKTALKGTALIRTLFLTVARLLHSTTGRRRSALLTGGGLIGVSQACATSNNPAADARARRRQSESVGTQPGTPR